MKKDPLSSKAPEKPMHEVSGGNVLLSSETILRTNKRGMETKNKPPPHTQPQTGNFWVNCVKFGIAETLNGICPFVFLYKFGHTHTERVMM